MKIAMKRLKVNLLIFDLDGTLVDTRQDLARAVNFVRAELGLVDLDTDEVMRHVGDGARNLIARSIPKNPDQRVDEGLKLFRQHYRDHLLDTSDFYPNVYEILTQFRRKKLAVLSNKPEEFTKMILEGLEVDHLFEIVLGGDSLTFMKPDPAPILHILNALRVTPPKAIIIGDSPGDIEAGRAAGILTCAVTYGYRPKEILERSRPDFIVDDFNELTRILR